MRERLWELLARALYASQRQADALQALRWARHYLVDELGLDPNPQLRAARGGRPRPGRLPRTQHRAGPRAGRGRSRPHPAESGSALVGRAAALTALDDVLTQARGGRGRLVLVSGEPGIGKTRLAEAAVALATAGGMRCGWGGWTPRTGRRPCGRG